MRRHKFLTSMVLAGMTLAIACGGDDGSGPPPPDPPVFGSVDTTTVAPGDTITITGSNFSTVAGENTVTFKNPLSATKPFQATANELRVVVDPDATSGRVTVTTAGGFDHGDSITVVRGVGDVFVFGGLGANNVLSLPNPGVIAQYLIVPHATNSGVSPQTNLGYTIDSESAIPVVAAQEGAGRLAPLPGHAGPHEWFESQRWENAQRVVEQFGRPRGAFEHKPESVAPAGGTRQFYVLNTTASDPPDIQNRPSSYTRITAELRYNGTKCLVYADIDTLASGNFTQTHFDLFGETFDNSIDDINQTYFGAHSDVDGNGKVILLISPVVNRLEEPGCAPTDCGCGFIAGFFNPRDLYDAPPVPSGTTNHAEILYLLAADPGGFWDCPFPLAATAIENLGTITHEHEHLISFSHRLFHQGQVTQVTWLEEGMAHMAEDLNGDNSSNEARGTRYREDIDDGSPGGPEVISLEDNRATLEQRGGIYLMLRLLCDRYGTDILKTIVQSQCTGRACIQNVTGLGFYQVFAEFLAAQYLSGKGITSDERFNYTSIDLDDFGVLFVGQHAAGEDVGGTVRRASGEFQLFTGVAGQTSRFRFIDNSGQAGLRSVVVRTQ